MPTHPHCRVTTNHVGSLGAIVIENELLSATILLDKGADILSLVHKRSGIDVMWKTPWGLKRHAPGVSSATSSTAIWLELYPGGWQEIFPNGGAPCAYKGAELNMHGEASMTTWDAEIIVEAGDAAEVKLTTRLARSPFRLQRAMRVGKGRAVLEIHERITNEGDEPMAYMWGHHPALGAPFLSEACRIDLDAATIVADDAYDPPFNPMQPASSYRWPIVQRDGRETDLSRIPPRSEPSACLGYLSEFRSGWYGVTNTELGFGFGLTWPTDVFPFAWLWRELSASSGYPWYRCAHTMAIEPFSTIPGQGLETAIRKGTHRTLAPGASVTADLNAVLYDSRTGISGISPDGHIIQRT